MKYAAWVGRDIKKEWQRRGKLFNESHAQEYEKTVRRLLRDPFTEAVLNKFEADGFDAFSMDFIDQLSYCIQSALRIPPHELVGKTERKKRVKEAKKLITSLKGLLADFGIDHNLILEMDFIEKNLLLATGRYTEEQLATRITYSFDTEVVSYTRSDLLDQVAKEIEQNASDPQMIPLSGTNESGQKERVFFIKQLYVEFMRHFGNPFATSITLLGTMFLDDIVISQDTVDSNIARYKKSLKKYYGTDDIGFAGSVLAYNRRKSTG